MTPYVARFERQQPVFLFSGDEAAQKDMERRLTRDFISSHCLHRILSQPLNSTLASSKPLESLVAEFLISELPFRTEKDIFSAEVSPEINRPNAWVIRITSMPATTAKRRLLPVLGAGKNFGTK